MYGIEKLTFVAILAVAGCAAEDDKATQKEVDQRQEQAERQAPEGDAKDLGRDLEKVGADMGDAVEEAGDGVGDAAKDVGNAISEGVKEVGEDLSDAAITTRVKDALAHDKDLEGAKIDVETVNGVVTLRGSTQSLGARLHATSVARVIRGVERVENKIAVN